jgi:polysaccharide chain length determinant protein (PEP-CTERM system associated)
MEKKDTFQIEYYLELAVKRRWLLIIPFCIAMLSGLYLVFALPKIYRANTLILVRPQRVPTDYVRSVVSTDIDQRINTIKQQIMSRTNLERIIEEFKLFSGPDNAEMFMENKIAVMRARIDVDVTRSSRSSGADSFSVSYRASDPQTVMNVANTLANYFIDENLKVREAQAIGTSGFLDDQLTAMRIRLEEVEKQLGGYRKKYMGELPEQLDTNLRVLDRLQLQLNERQANLQEAKNRLFLLDNQIEANKNLQAAGVSASSDTGQPLTLAQLKQQLADLKASYTDRHPDVIRLKRQIEDSETKAAETESGSGAPNQKRSGSPTPLTQNRFLADQIQQRNATYLEIKDLESELANMMRQIKEYQRRVEVTPKREEELLTLNRDYENIQESYKSLLNRKLEADIAVNMEKKQKGEQFRIVDHARLPQKPVSPDLKKLLMLAVAAGLGLGGGLIFLLDYLDTSLKRPDDIEADLGVPVLATIPRLYQPKGLMLKKLNWVLTGFGVLVGFLLLAVFGVLVLKGVNPTIEFVQQHTSLPIQKVISKISL